MTKLEVITKIKYARHLHVIWANKQAKRIDKGLKILPNAGGENWHNEWVEIYDETLKYLNGKAN